MTTTRLDTAATQKHASDDKSQLGFWIYLMTDCILFGSLFATYIVLHNNTFGGPSGNDIFEMPAVLVETLLLLTSSFTCGLAMIAMRQRSKKFSLFWLGFTFLLGLAFLIMELTEFNLLISEGYSWQRSGFLSAFFTLVGTHGLHITIGLLWLLVMGWKLFKHGLTAPTVRRFNLFSMFWHFLDIIWIFIFTFVYLMGVL
ncbi:MAG: putative cytochrome o ubiquinol oxidase chain cyoC [Candidatus Saccharibacteria bacterium]|nr:putative cytochrome o ubiquinol oxidase chain cyoC [Candidatus Saccharibacteria bacterium]